MLLNDPSLNFSPESLSENPQLALLLVLRTLLHMTSLSLTADTGWIKAGLLAVMVTPGMTAP